MGMKRKGIALGVMLALCMSSQIYAAEATNPETEIAVMKERLEQLEATVRAQSETLWEDSSKIKTVEKKQNTQDENRQNGFKISGDARIRAIDSETSDGYKYDQRVRIQVDKLLNPDTFFRMRTLFMDDNEWGTSTGDEKARVDNAYFQFNRLGGSRNQQLRIGRYSMLFGSKSSGLGGYDGLEYTVGFGDLRVSAGLGDWGANTKLGKNYYLTLNYALSKSTNMGLWTIKETSANDGVKDYDIKGAGFKTKLNGNFAIACDYWNNTGMNSGDKDGKWLTLYYKNALYSQPKTYGLQFYYRDVEKGSIPSTLAVSGVDISSLGYKGPGIGFEYVPVKNVKTCFRMAFGTKDAGTNESLDNYYRFEVNCIF